MSNTKLKQFMSQMSFCIDQGLGKETQKKATIKCWQTYVQDMPTGNEEGEFLALDLGGSNFRVLKLELGINKYFKMDQQTYVISKDLMIGSGIQLFDYIAECLNNFVNSQGIKSTSYLPLGFTFSFPISQLSINSGKLVRWTKGFTCDGVVDEDVVKLLNKSIKKSKDLNVTICSLLNDTVGTLMSCAWLNSKTKIGLIVGTGCNCCYVEKVKNIKSYNGSSTKEEMIINLEWGAFGDNDELSDFLTKYDKIVDRNSEHPSQQIFEKMVSGKYLGELLRLILLDMIKGKLIFDGMIPKILNTPQSLTTNVISLIESDPPGTFTNSRKFLREIGVNNSTDSDCMNLRYAAECISKRSAHLVAAGLTVLLNKMNTKDVTIGVDGSVYRYHPFYHQLLVDKINELVNIGIKFDIILSEDGSGRGAAILASAVCKKSKE
ncbi:Hexokinase, N-terminal,Hexokinase, binding site,Hexokinase,Hexokinase, C-terminal [Cinara cedri]|uniref:Phosphotransferase n=1 Tax=Cinara cedri TaxID=506608 RepID=A0A5E4MJQ3_9HEMI|nr:Hexokinase, N-terminal,Hexokinase, binding site,Hexokinase,Hexokinase, C-terminal [Cinara cedri]